MNIEYSKLLPHSPTCEHRNNAFEVPAEIPQVGEEFTVSVACKETGCNATATETLTFTGPSR